MTEVSGQTSVQGTRYEIARTIPRNEEGERTGTGAMLTKIGPGLFGEKVSNAVMKAYARTGRIIEVPPDGVKQAENLPGSGYDREQSKRADVARLMQADEQQTTQALEGTRSSLQREIAAQEEAARPQHQASSEGKKQLEDTNEKPLPKQTELIHFYNRNDGYEQLALQLPRNFTAEDVDNALKRAGFTYKYSSSPEKWLPKSDKTVMEERIAQGKDPDMETEVIRSEKDGHVLATFEVPKNATLVERERAAQAAGFEKVSSGGAARRGLRARGSDLWAVLKMFFQSVTSSEAQQQSDKAA